MKASVYDTSLTGYYCLSVPYAGGAVLMILDHSGDVVYYKPVKQDVMFFNFGLLSNGLFCYGNMTRYFLMDSTFKMVDSIDCVGLYKTDPHDMKLLPNGHYLVTGFDSVAVIFHKDTLASPPVHKDTAVALLYAVIQELDEKKNVVFEWHAKDHFDHRDVDSFFVTIKDGLIDLNHVNAIEGDSDGNILLLSRNYNEITKINRHDGSVMWRFGGKCNEFTFVDCPVPFYGPHDVRRIGNGHITLLDNGRHYVSHRARALEFKLDEKKKTATLVKSFTYNDDLISKGHGNVQPLNDSKKLVAYGNVPDCTLIFVVIDSTGRVLWELSSPDHLDSYRSFYYSSLPWKVNRPQIECFDSLGIAYLKTTQSFSSYKWNETIDTKVFPVTEPGTYYVFVPYGDGGFISSEKMVVTNTSDPCNYKSSLVPETKKNKNEKD